MSASFICVKCGSPYSAVTNSRQTPDRTVRIRNRRCQQCKNETITEEYVVGVKNMKRAMIRRKVLEGVMDLIEEYGRVNGPNHPPDKG